MRGRWRATRCQPVGCTALFSRCTVAGMRRGAKPCHAVQGGPGRFGTKGSLVQIQSPRPLEAPGIAGEIHGSGASSFWRGSDRLLMCLEDCAGRDRRTEWSAWHPGPLVGCGHGPARGGHCDPRRRLRERFARPCGKTCGVAPTGARHAYRCPPAIRHRAKLVDRS